MGRTTTPRELMIPQMVRLDSLHCDYVADGGYQRPLAEAKVNAIIKNFMPEAVGVGIVADRTGTLFIVDSNTRAAALRKMGYAEFPAIVFKSHGREHEAAVFSICNGKRTNVPAWVQFRASVLAGDGTAIGVVAMCEQLGLVVAEKQRAWPQIACVRALMSSYRADGGVSLRKALHVIVKAWSGEEMALTSYIVAGLSRLMYRVDGIDLDRLIAKVSKQSPEGVIRQSDPQKLAGGGQGRTTETARTFARIYNTRNRRKIEFD